MEQQAASDLLKQLIDQSYNKGFESGRKAGLEEVTNSLLEFLGGYTIKHNTSDQKKDHISSDKDTNTSHTCEVQKGEKIKAVVKGPKLTKKNRAPLSKEAESSLSSLRKTGLPWKVYDLIVDKNSVGGISTKRIFSHMSSLRSTRGKQLTMATLNVSLNTLMTKRLITYTGKGSDRVWFLV